MTLHPIPGSRQKVRATSSEHAAGPRGAGPVKTCLSEDVHTRIAELAYQFYEQRGREDGFHVEDWIQAEQRILASQA